MRLTAARVQKYRSIQDTGWFEIENNKTILVGANEAGKSAILRALQQIKPPADVPKFDALRDYPRSDYNDITTGKVDARDVDVVSAKFCIEAQELEGLPEGFENAAYVFTRHLDNSASHRIEGGPSLPAYDGTLSKDLSRLAAHTMKQFDAATGTDSPEQTLASTVTGWTEKTVINKERGVALEAWLTSVLPLVDEEDSKEDDRYDRLLSIAKSASATANALKHFEDRMPLIVLFNNYFRVQPSIHLDHLATRLENGLLDDDQYDYGNQCLLKLLGFTARELSSLGKAVEPSAADPGALKQYKDQLDKRSYQLNAASVRLTKEIRSVWNPNPDRAEADKLRVTADGQYLKVVVEDDLGVEIELDQRSEGFQWLVSFFVVFFAEAAGKHENAILLLDEPGLSLHGLKQRDFRDTITRLSEKNQTIYTTHSPFLVGPDELDLVRVIEMTDRKLGTKVSGTLSAANPASLLPLQEALGYDLAQSLFTQQKNLVLEGLTDYWYLDATSQLLSEGKKKCLDEKIALLPANGSGKVVYFATILFANKLKVAALLDSDNAGDTAAQQETLVHSLGNSNILRTKDAYKGPVQKPEIEDLLRETLVSVAKSDLGWDVKAVAEQQPKRPIVDIFTAEIPDFSKYKLAKAYLRWTRAHIVSDLTAAEVAQWESLFVLINKALK